MVCPSRAASAVRALLTEGLLPELAGALLGGPAVLYKEKVNYKAPGGAAGGRAMGNRW